MQALKTGNDYCRIIVKAQEACWNT